MDWLTDAESALLAEARETITRLERLARRREHHAWGFDPFDYEAPRSPWVYIPSEELSDKFAHPSDPFFTPYARNSHRPDSHE